MKLIPFFHSRRWGWILAVLVAGCSFQTSDGPPEHPLDVSAIPDAIPQFEPRSRAANPDSYEVLGQRYHVMKTSRGHVERGTASWYGKKFHGHPTASGEPYDMYAMTAAHKTLPIPSYARVTNLRNGRSVVVKINDRGPFHSQRIIDLSYAAGVKLGIDKTGTAPVEVKVVEPTPDVQSAKTVYLQVGAFSERDNAHRLMTRLTQIRPLKAEIHSTLHRGHPLYRVRFGPLDSQAEVDSLTQQLRALGVNPTVVFNN